jgi:hypothetical protein
MAVKYVLPLPEFKFTDPREFIATRATHTHEKNALLRTYLERFPSEKAYPTEHPDLAAFNKGEKINWKFPADMLPTDEAFFKRQYFLAVLKNIAERMNYRAAVERDAADEHARKVWVSEGKRLLERMAQMALNSETQSTLLNASRLQAMDKSDFTAEFLLHRVREDDQFREAMFLEAQGLTSHGVPMHQKSPFTATHGDLNEAVAKLMTQKGEQTARNLREFQWVMAAHELMAWTMLGYNNPGAASHVDPARDYEQASKVSSLKSNVTKKVA